MQTDIYYRDITKSEHLENYLMDKVEGAIENFLKYERDAHLTVRVDKARERKGTRGPLYKCEVVLKPVHSRSIIKVSKQDEDFATCVNKTVVALKKILSRRSSIKAEHRRRDRTREVASLSWEDSYEESMFTPENEPRLSR
jgi:ribosome-associated translation inhibitor RaiA